MAKTSKSKGGSLKRGRPPLGHDNTRPLVGGSLNNNRVNSRAKSSKATRALINAHHQLHKARAAAVAANNSSLVGELDEQLQNLGGLEAYQAASLTGQRQDRGGDSSEKLVEWLREHNLIRTTPCPLAVPSLRVLEIGALSSRNAISKMIGRGIETVKRIDLHSQEPDQIEEIDFMQLPVPESDEAKFDIVSLSLVLNYVPDVSQRGQMLQRTTSFLRQSSIQGRDSLPCLFVVLPLPCLTNSRYMTHDHFVEILASLGYRLINRHDSKKLSYTLFKWTHHNATKIPGFKKTEINPGKSKNNFAIVLTPSQN